MEASRTENGSLSEPAELVPSESDSLIPSSEKDKLRESDFSLQSTFFVHKIASPSSLTLMIRLVASLLGLGRPISQRCHVFAVPRCNFSVISVLKVQLPFSIPRARRVHPRND